MTRTSRKQPAAPTAAVVRAALEESYRGPAWHGPSVLVALKRVSPESATWRPADRRNSIWGIVLHLAYARHRVLGRLARMNGHRAGRFTRPRHPEWFPLLPEPADEGAWRADLELLERAHAELFAEIDRTPDAALATTRRAGGRTIGEELLGLALHDAYHAGQIRLIAKLAGAARAG